MAPSSSDPPQNDALLLRCYVREGSEAAFRALAGRHLPLIWSTARRIVNGDAALAEDIAQSVLVDFARHAASLPAGMPAAGWLHRHTVFTATKCLRTEARRRARERTAALPEDAMSPDRESWAELAPHLDDALNRLREQDRQAILLRYYEKLTLREVGQALGTSEEAVRKRLDRAVEKLRRLFARRGLVPAAAVLLLMLKNESVAAPAGAAMRRIIGAAWSTLESGPVAPAPPRVWWRSRSLGGSAAAILILSLGVWLWLDHDSSGQEHHERRSLHSSVPTAPVSARQMEEGPPVTLTATVMILPEADVAPHMIDYNPGEDDAALYGQLLPRATALQAQTPQDATLATTG